MIEGEHVETENKFVKVKLYDGTTMDLEIIPVPDWDGQDVSPCGPDTIGFRKGSIHQKNGEWTARIQGHGVVEISRNLSDCLKALAEYWKKIVDQNISSRNTQEIQARLKEEEQKKERAELISEIVDLTSKLQDTPPPKYENIWGKGRRTGYNQDDEPQYASIVVGTKRIVSPEIENLEARLAKSVRRLPRAVSESEAWKSAWAKVGYQKNRQPEAEIIVAQLIAEPLPQDEAEIRDKALSILKARGLEFKIFSDQVTIK